MMRAGIAAVAVLVAAPSAVVAVPIEAKKPLWGEIMNAIRLYSKLPSSKKEFWRNSGGFENHIRFGSELRFCKYFCRVILCIHGMSQVAMVGTCKLDTLACAYPALRRHSSETNML